MSGSHTHAGISFTRGCPTCEEGRKQVATAALEDAVKTAQRFHGERYLHDEDVRELARIVALIGTELLALRYGNE